MEFYKKHKSAVDKMIFISISIGVIYIFFNYIYSYVAPFVWGFILSLILAPIVGAITKNTKIPRGIATVFSIFIFIFILGAIFNGLIGRVVEEGRSFFQYLPEHIESTAMVFENVGEKFNILYDIIPLENHAVSEIITSALSSITSLAGPALGSVSTNFVTKIPDFLLGFVLMLISSFFFTKDRELMNNSLKKLIPKYLKAYVGVLKSGIITGVMGYIKAQCILMSIVAVICVTGLVILKAPYALFLGVVIAIVDALPVFGSGFFYWPWMAFSMLSGNYTMAIGLAVIYISIMFTRQLLEPKILGGQIGVHPLITLISIYAGLRLFGFFGIFIGPCIAIVVKAIYEMPDNMDLHDIVI